MTRRWRDPEIADESDLVLRGGEQMRRGLRRNTFAGCGSNVTTTGVPWPSLAWRAEVEMTA